MERTIERPFIWDNWILTSHVFGVVFYPSANSRGNVSIDYWMVHQLWAVRHAKICYKDTSSKNRLLSNVVRNTFSDWRLKTSLVASRYPDDMSDMFPSFIHRNTTPKIDPVYFSWCKQFTLILSKIISVQKHFPGKNPASSSESIFQRNRNPQILDIFIFSENSNQILYMT